MSHSQKSRIAGFLKNYPTLDTNVYNCINFPKIVDLNFIQMTIEISA